MRGRCATPAAARRRLRPRASPRPRQPGNSAEVAGEQQQREQRQRRRHQAVGMHADVEPADAGHEPAEAEHAARPARRPRAAPVADHAREPAPRRRSARPVAPTSSPRARSVAACSRPRPSRQHQRLPAGGEAAGRARRGFRHRGRRCRSARGSRVSLASIRCASCIVLMIVALRVQHAVHHQVRQVVALRPGCGGGLRAHHRQADHDVGARPRGSRS